MDRITYLSQPPVQNFIEWTTPFVTGERPLIHSWDSPKLGNFSCQTLYHAYAQYSWSGTDFDSTEKFLDGLRLVLRDAQVTPARFMQAAIDVMDWGGIRRYDRLIRLGYKANEVLRENANRLNPQYADIDRLSGFKYMGAGYSKIYSLMLDGFPIYDSRVACALTSLIWQFGREKSLAYVPDELLLGVPRGESKRMNRNPFRFPNITQEKVYAISNVKAAWILGELANLGKFQELPADQRVSALQAALFMIGYKPLSLGALK